MVTQDEQIKEITKKVVGLETDIKDMHKAIEDIKGGQKTIEYLLREIEKKC